LAAHEVGHTLGLEHNYLASTADRASVMDYPHPLVKLAPDGSIDLSEAYASGIGEWDKVAIAYGYQDFPKGTDQSAALERILAEGRRRGVSLLTDQDARPQGSVHPQAHLWDNGSDAARELGRMMQVRRTALVRFGENAIRRGMPLATMEEALVPLYLHHRYQVEAAVKVVGGQYYTYALRGDGQEPVRAVPAAEQERALSAVLATLDPAELALPRGILAKLPPRPALYEPHRELFARNTGLAFDALTPAAGAADLVVSLLLHPERAARLEEQHALDAGLPSLSGVIDRLIGRTFGPAGQGRDGYQAELARTVQRVVVERLMALAASAPLPQVRAIAALKLESLRTREEAAARAGTDEQRAHAALLAADIRRFAAREFTPEWKPWAPPVPPGSPIGDDGD
jgi:hypothetical protein